MKEGKLLRVKHVAEALSLHEMSVYRLIKSGEIIMNRIGGRWFITREDLDILMKRRNSEEFIENKYKRKGLR